MRRVHFRSALAALSFGLAASTHAAGGAPPAEDIPLRAADVRLSIVTPSPAGPWTAVIRNHDRVPVRVIADARNLRLLARKADSSVYALCELPADMRGGDEPRQVVLQPGDSYEESFDPALFCWGKLHDELAPGASITAFLGWPPDTRLERRHKPQRPPFVVDPAQAPAEIRSDKQIASLTTWLAPADAKPAHGDDQPKPPPPAPSDAVTPLGVARLELSANRFEDATSFRSASVLATIKNAGDRSAVVHLRPDDLELRVSGPYGKRATCAPGNRRRAVARDFFQTVAPGKSSSVQVLVNEVCPRGTFDRPGLYLIDVALRATERGAEFGLDATTGEFRAPQPVLLRVHQSALPYHRDPPAIRHRQDK